MPGGKLLNIIAEEMKGTGMLFGNLFSRDKHKNSLMWSWKSPFTIFPSLEARIKLNVSLGVSENLVNAFSKNAAKCIEENRV